MHARQKYEDSARNLTDNNWRMRQKYRNIMWNTTPTSPKCILKLKSCAMFPWDKSGHVRIKSDHHSQILIQFTLHQTRWAPRFASSRPMESSKCLIWKLWSPLKLSMPGKSSCNQNVTTHSYFFVYCRKRNASTAFFLGPTPRMDEFLDWLGYKKIFYKRDAPRSYWQVVCVTKVKEKRIFLMSLAFLIHLQAVWIGKAPDTFQSETDVILSANQWPFA